MGLLKSNTKNKVHKNAFQNGKVKQRILMFEHSSIHPKQKFNRTRFGFFVLSYFFFYYW